MKKDQIEQFKSKSQNIEFVSLLCNIDEFKKEDYYLTCFTPNFSLYF